MSLNERPLEPFDPFHSGHPATLAGPIERIKVGNKEVIVQPFTLPHSQKVTPAEWNRHAVNFEVTPDDLKGRGSKCIQLRTDRTSAHGDRRKLASL